MKKHWILLDCKKAQLKASLVSDEAMYKYLTLQLMAAQIKVDPLRWIVIKPEERYNPFVHAGRFIEDYERELKMSVGD